MSYFDKCLQMFIKDLKNVKKLSPQETVDLIVKYRVNKSKRILDQIIMGNIWFIISRAKRYASKYLSSSDLIYSGIVGMKRAVEKFDVNRNIKFLTYASYWVEMYIRREVIYNSSIVKMTPRAWEMSVAINKLKSSGATDDEIIEKLKIGRGTFRKLRKSNIDMSLNTSIGEAGDFDELEDILLIDHQSPADICSENDLSDYLNKAISKLRLREKDIIEWKFGLGDKSKTNLREIGSMQNVSPERIRQILRNGLKKLKVSIQKRENV